MESLCKLTPEEIIMMSTAAAFELSRGKTADELTVLRFMASQISQTIATIAAQKQLLEKHCGNSSDKTFKT